MLLRIPQRKIEIIVNVKLVPMRACTSASPSITVCQSIVVAFG